MIRIMLVEDEPPILRDIKTLIESTNPDYKVVTCAFDGQQAINSLQTADLPDIIITDIQLPVVDGLELITYIKNQELDIVPIILSGYSEFEYAKRALSLGVADYLLKPVNPRELSKLLSDLSIKINTKKQNAKRDYISCLLEDSSTNMSGMDINASSYLLMLICAGSFKSYSFDYDSPQKSFWESIDLAQFGNSILESGEEIWIFNGKISSEKIVLLTLGSSSSERVDLLADKFLNHLCTSKISITIAASLLMEKVQVIGAALQSLRYLLCKNIIIGFSQIIRQYGAKEQNVVIPADTGAFKDSVAEKLVFSLKQGDIMQFKLELSHTFKYLSESRYPQIFVEKFLQEIILNCCKSLANLTMTSVTDLEHEISEAAYVSFNYSELFSNLWYIFEELFEIRSHCSKDLNNTSIIMQKVDNYIKENISQPVNLQLLSDKFGLVPSYLSRLYKEYKGMSPIEHLTTLRIDKARELIRTQDNMFAKDIAALVGYSDPLHFSKIFKKETGMSPSEFKNSLKK